jgi:hypothetical protein
MPLLVAVIAALKLFLHLAVAGRYGYFRDELYYIACSRHLDWGYVDQPPLIALITWLEMHIGGSSLHSLRFLPAVAGAALVILAAKLAKELGAGKFGQWFAALATACIGVNFVTHYLLTMNAFEPLLWTGCAYVLARIVNTGDERLWIWFGVLAGIGLQNKYSIVIFAAGLIFGLLCTPERKSLLRPWIWIGGGIAFLIFLPNFIWNVQHHWPFLELISNIKKSGRDVVVGPIEFLGQQTLILGPQLLPVWVIGLASLLFGKSRRYRALGLAYLFSLVFLIATHGKHYYLAPAYTTLIAAGAAAIERFVEGRHLVWMKPVMAVAIVAMTVYAMPLVLPLLTPEQFQIYATKYAPFAVPASEKSHQRAALPQHFADQFGWEEMTAAVNRAYQALPAGERAETCIAASNYGEAGAIDFFGPRYGLPAAISAHQNYFLWGPRDCSGKVLIALGDRLETWEKHCHRAEVAAELYHPYGIPFENRPVIVCHGLRANLQKVWPRLKDWD